MTEEDRETMPGTGDAPDGPAVPAGQGAPVRRSGPPGQGTLREESRPGRRAWSFPDLDVPDADLPEDALRREPPTLPEVAERDLVRHFTRLSQENYGVDTGFYPLGSCSMKYNPKLAEDVAAMPGFRRLHPWQPESQIQGALQLLVELEEALCAVTGMEAVTFQPAAADGAVHCAPSRPVRISSSRSCSASRSSKMAMPGLCHATA